MLILATSSQTFHSYFPLFNVNYLKIANWSNLTIVFYPFGNFGQAFCIRSCHEDLILTRKSHNCSGIAFIQGDSEGGSKLIEQTITSLLPRLRNHNATDDRNVEFRSFRNISHLRVGKLMLSGWFISSKAVKWYDIGLISSDELLSTYQTKLGW